MKINKLSIKFHGVEHGWLAFTMFANNKPILNVSASGVYNPFYDYTDILFSLQNGYQKNFKTEFTWNEDKTNYKYNVTRFYNKNRMHKLLIDQEGYYTSMTFEVRNNLVFLTTETLRSKLRPNRDLPKYTGVFKKSQVIKEMKRTYVDFYKKNRFEMENEVYPFTFNESIMRCIK